MRVRTVRRSQQSTSCRSCRIHETLKLKRCDNIPGLTVGILVKLIHTDRVEACGNNDRAVLLFNDFILLRIIDSTCGTYL